MNIAIPLLLGEALAWAQGLEVDLGLVLVAHGFGVLDQCFIVWANDLADEAADRDNEHPTFLSGGSGVLREGTITAPQLARAAMGTVIAMLGLSLYAAFALDRPATPLAWAVAVLLLWAYSFRPARLSYRGGGALAQAFGMMVVLPVLGYYLQSGRLQGLAWLALIPGVILGIASNINTALPDQPSDRRTQKLTWPVRYGSARARVHCLQLIALGAVGTPWVLPEASQALWAAIEAPPLLLVLINAHGLDRAEVAPGRTGLRFVVLNGLALNLTLIGWIIGLITTA